MSTMLSWAFNEEDFGNNPKDKMDETEIRGQEKIRQVNTTGWQSTVESECRVYLPDKILGR